MSSTMRAAILSLALVACTPFVAPSLVVPLGTNDWGDFALLVYDDSGLVTSGRAAERRPSMASDEVIALPERQELDIGWTGGACSHRPTLQLSGDSSALRLVIRNPNDEKLLPVSCPAVGIPLWVTLSLSEAVAQDALALEVSY